jgi:hypothetical protein
MSLPIVYLSTCGLISTLEAPWFVFNQVTAISLSKCPMLQTSFIFHLLKWEPNDIFISSCSNYYISISNNSVNFLTSKPSIAAKAQIGSSVTVTIDPAPLKEAAAFSYITISTYNLLPASIISVARRTASTADSLQPYLLSNFDLVTSH